MLTEPNINKELIKEKIEQNYDLTISSLTPVKGGEASWCYIVKTKTGEKFFLKIYVGLESHEERFNLTYNLFNNCEIKNITRPIKSKNDELVIDIANHYVALFNYIDGSNASEKDLTDSQKFEFGKLLGTIHQANNIIRNFNIKEDFKYGNLNRLLENINKSNSFIKDKSQYKSEAAKLLTLNKEKISKRIEELEKLGNKLAKEDLEFVICHGEPHEWNTMVSKEGEVFLIDWDDSLLAPKEKDLNMIKEDPEKMAGYKAVVGEFEINEEIIKYYNLEWNISEIDAWSNQIFHSGFNDEQSTHDLKFLKSVLEELDKEY